MTNPQTEFDSPWKEILQLYFEEFMLFFFPEAHREIDWSRPPEFLDQELQQVIRDAELGKRLVDKLVKIYRIGGEESWILVHVEVQAQEESDFARRMYSYNYRIFDRYNRPVASIAVLGDEGINWLPSQFGYDLFGCHIDFQFPIIKLLEYKDRQADLEASRNPFATVVMAHLAALATRGDRLKRKEQKLRLVKKLYDRGFRRKEVINLLAFIDWMLTLPSELEREFQYEVEQLEVERKMRYITSFERLGMEKGLEKGIEKGLIKGIAVGLKLKFGESGQNLLPEIESIEDVEKLSAILDAIENVNSVDELRQIYCPASN